LFWSVGIKRNTIDNIYFCKQYSKSLTQHVCQSSFICKSWLSNVANINICLFVYTLIEYWPSVHYYIILCPYYNKCMGKRPQFAITSQPRNYSGSQQCFYYLWIINTRYETRFCGGNRSKRITKKHFGDNIK